MKKQVRYQDQKYNQTSSSQRLQPAPHPMKMNQNNAVQLLHQNRFAQQSNKSTPSASKIVNKQFFNANPTRVAPRGSTPTPSSKSPVRNSKPETVASTFESFPQKNASIDQSSSPNSQLFPTWTNSSSGNDADGVNNEKSRSSSSNKSSRSKLRRRSSKNVQAQTQEFLRYGRGSSRSRMDRISSRRSIEEDRFSHIENENNARTNPFYVQEAAARLSFPWPAPSIYEPSLNKKDEERRSLTLSQNRAQALKEIYNFFETNQDLMKLPGVKSVIRKAQNVSGSYNSQEEEDPLEAVIESLKKIFMKNGLPVKRMAYKPFVTPKFEKAESNWPGFENRPIPNWMDYASPDKIMPQRQPKLDQLKNKKKSPQKDVRWKDDSIANKNKPKNSGRPGEKMTRY